MEIRAPGALSVAACLAALLAVLMAPGAGRAQAPAAPDGATLFKRQCGVCHTAGAGEPNRQGPNLHGVVGRVAGKQEGFRYSPALAGSEIRWDAATLDAWLADSAKLVPGSVMPYRQANPAIRGAIIDWLKEGN
ncbi:c-type cytochrome [Roseomonas gilardii subsp. gilardii]|uniref:c-type cytochrome n=1 Tax=Roseomonas gilardii TaxID=257708 RepID=UPI001FF8248A|nr:c-type cytochrome [Roseomonas gilardii]UPG72357.1 c-type cytochrome [Roseomonas gilardii subsp. gilardii]